MLPYSDVTKIDIFCHILPQRFFDRMVSISSRGAAMQKRVREIPILTDLDVRLRLMDTFAPYQQVFSIATPALDTLAGPDQTPELARIANDGMAEIAARHPDRFPSFVASLPMNNPEASVQEIDRAIGTLGATGVQIFSNVGGRPLDDPAFEPVFRRMAELDLPIWLHPWRGPEVADYVTETTSKYDLWWVFGWPYETSCAMARIVFAGYFDKYPTLKVIVHHMGAMVPYFEMRVGPGLDQLGRRMEGDQAPPSLKRRPYDYFKMFYTDTALFGAQAGMECGLKFFGPDRVLFASDMPFDPEKGPGYIRSTIACLEAMKLPGDDLQKIYEGNARRLLRLKAG
jgi:predicted TIM-barrel fold metal-dependent hydrolase